jgi:Fe-S cluster assembly iron-binding protein IscA
MALDEPRDSDNVFNVNGFQFIIDKEFYEKAKPVTVDFMGYGFRISSSINFGAGAGCGGCHGSCSTEQK